ncbi:unnamed protein product [Staurois parvus]|uniref:Uncharacterized protein n=1 Tax=Staurois parvus TaxID=386267 RepID=A0ABN9ASA7_9NEOB|nr:unnamed protein product [Staurois parvus]
MTGDNYDNIRDEYLPSFPQENTHPFQAGDRTVVKQLTRNKKQQDFAYGPETTVVAVTRTAVLTEHSPTWIHAFIAKLVGKAQDQT